MADIDLFYNGIPYVGFILLGHEIASPASRSVPCRAPFRRRSEAVSMRRAIKSAVIAMGAAAAITILVLGSSGASANSCTPEHPCELERVEPPIDPPVWENQLMLRAMAQQQQTLLALNSVMVQMQLVQIEIANTLHQIQATQASGGSK